MLLQNIIASLIGFGVVYCGVIYCVVNGKTGNIAEIPVNIFWLAVRTAVLFTGLCIFFSSINLSLYVVYCLFLLSLLLLIRVNIFSVIPLSMIYILAQWTLGFPDLQLLLLDPIECRPNKPKQPETEMIGHKCTVRTALRPVGTVLINDKIYHATSDTGFVEKGSQVEVIRQKDLALMVRPVNSSTNNM